MPQEVTSQVPRPWCAMCRRPVAQFTSKRTAPCRITFEARCHGGRQLVSVDEAWLRLGELRRGVAFAPGFVFETFYPPLSVHDIKYSP